MTYINKRNKKVFLYALQHVIQKLCVSLHQQKGNTITVLELREPKTKTIMRNEILTLQYQIRRYQSMGNGIMCQALNNKLHKLLEKQEA